MNNSTSRTSTAFRWAGHALVHGPMSLAGGALRVECSVTTQLGVDALACCQQGWEKRRWTMPIGFNMPPTSAGRDP